MKKENAKQMREEEREKFNRRFKLVIYAYVVIEFVAIAVAVYYKIYR